MEYILVTGGLGFIGSHTCLELLNNNYNVIIVDNLYNSKIDTYFKLQTLSGIRDSRLLFYNRDLLTESIEDIFDKHYISNVIHFAGLKSVSESVKLPLLYYESNIQMTINLLKVMNEYECKNIIFSSSACVYGNSNWGELGFSESDKVGQNIINSYGRTKYIIEHILQDLYLSDKEWSITILRYFNPVGAHESGMLGEDPNDIPNNLMPYILKVAKGIYPFLSIYGNDYPTSDGTCVRDFIHVVDLAKGHIAALKNMNNSVNIYNLGSGVGISVKQIVDTFININSLTNFEYKFVERRSGDSVISFANVQKAKAELKWQTEKTLEDICRDAYRYCINN